MSELKYLNLSAWCSFTLYPFLLINLDFHLLLGSQVGQGSQHLLRAPERRLLLEALGILWGQGIQARHPPDDHKYSYLLTQFNVVVVRRCSSAVFFCLL